MLYCKWELTHCFQSQYAACPILSGILGFHFKDGLSLPQDPFNRIVVALKAAAMAHPGYSFGETVKSKADVGLKLLQEAGIRVWF